jgi:hypothetical protein
MKRIIVVIFLVAVAGIAGLVRSNSRTIGGIREWRSAVHHDESATDAREEIRKTYNLSPGARVEVASINGWVKIETSDTTTAEVSIERLGRSQEVLDRRKIVIDNWPDGLTIRGEKSEGSFFSGIFGSKPSEHVTLRLPKQIRLVARGINGAITSGEVQGPVEVHGVNGRVDIAQASGGAEFNGINGNVAVALAQLDSSIDIHGINGNIELRLGEKVNASLDAEGMNGSVSSDIPDVVVEKVRHGSYTAQIGNGENAISASGINGNIRLRRMMTASTVAQEYKVKSEVVRGGASGR